MKELRLDFGNQVMNVQIALAQSQDMLLCDFLDHYPARSAEPIPFSWFDLPLRSLKIIPVRLQHYTLDTSSMQVAYPVVESTTKDTRTVLAYEQHPHHPHHRHQTDSPSHSLNTDADTDNNGNGKGAEHHTVVYPADAFPLALTDSEAVARAYQTQIEHIGRYLSANLSVLVICDKVLASYIYRHAIKYANKQPIVEGDALYKREGNGETSLLSYDIAVTTVRIATITRLLSGIHPDQVLVLQHLDMLAGNNNTTSLSSDARHLTEVLYRSDEFTPTLLGFADPSVMLPDVLINRFAVRIDIAGICRDVIPRLVTRAEYERFDRFDHESLFKNVSGFNAIQMRNAMRYMQLSSTPATVATQLMEIIRAFKHVSSGDVQIPDVTFDHIGGYEEVKHELFEAIELITGKQPPFHADGLPYKAEENDYLPLYENENERLYRRRLAPRGFIFHGPPGTGKTLFAKAIANCMNATIQMVSGPEVMDMWVGKSESNLRHLFSVARRNAPSVIFFDEFDSIAMERSSVGDGGGRASHAVVAQLLSEMDGFHNDQDILVIGTTNRLDMIDRALLRPSRFQPVEIGLPDVQTRRQIARIHAALFAIELPDDTIIDLVATQTEGFNGDEVRAIFQALARDKRRYKQLTLDLVHFQIERLRQRHIHVRQRTQ